MMKSHLSALLYFLFSIVLIVGCKKNLHDSSNCFKLKSVYLYQGSNTPCSSIIWQVENSTDQDIPPGTFVTFSNNDSYDPSNVKLGDIAYLKLTMKVMKAPGIDHDCAYNWTYILQGDLCN